MSFIRPFKSSFLAPKPREDNAAGVLQPASTESLQSPFQSAASLTSPLASTTSTAKKLSPFIPSILASTSRSPGTDSVVPDINDEAGRATNLPEDLDLTDFMSPNDGSISKGNCEVEKETVSNEGERDHLDKSESFSQSFFDDMNKSVDKEEVVSSDEPPTKTVKYPSSDTSNGQKDKEHIEPAEEAVSDEGKRDHLDRSESFSQSFFDDMNKSMDKAEVVSSDEAPKKTVKKRSSNKSNGQKDKKHIEPAEEAVSDEGKRDHLDRSESFSQSFFDVNKSVDKEEVVASDNTPKAPKKTTKKRKSNKSDGQKDKEHIPSQPQKNDSKPKRKYSKKEANAPTGQFNEDSLPPPTKKCRKKRITPSGDAMSSQVKSDSSKGNGEEAREEETVAMENFSPDVLDDIYRAKERKNRRKMRAKDRLYNFKKIRSAGIYVECCDGNCKKWRYLPDVKDPSSIPEHWTCSMNPDPKFNSCEIAQEEFVEGDDIVETSYSLGSIVWAKLRGFPWWPAFVDDDPDADEFLWTNDFSRVPSWYHVVFFDRLDKVVSRAWIRAEDLRRYERASHDDLKATFDCWTPALEGNVRQAMAKADTALRMDLQKRRDKYCFYKGAEGKWHLPWHLDLNSS